jgi:dolichyl-phosphate-mannose-protein mannosyltransferase
MKRLLTPELLVLTVCSAASHFWRLFTPNAVAFDERYFKEFAGHYLNGTFYFDVHPPLVNLLYAGVARLAGVTADALLGDAPVPVLRVLPALCGTLIIPLCYVVLRELGAGRRVSTLGAIALLCENALLVDSRFAFVEPFLIATGLASVAAYLGARTRTGRTYWALLALSAVFAGLALSSKWTGASGLGVVMAAWAYDEWRARSKWRRRAGGAAVLTLIPAAIYLGTFAVHFALVRRVGVGQAGMSVAFRRTLIGDPAYDSTAHLSFAAKLADVHREMAVGNRSLQRVTHPASSPWYTWPIMKHPFALWENPAAGADHKQLIVLLGNPVVWWGGLAGGALAVLLLVRGRVSHDQRFAIAVLAGGYLINFVPFMAIQRVMYLYHYLFAVVWLALLAAYAVGALCGWLDDDEQFAFASRSSRRTYFALVTLIIVAFAYFSPLTYGRPISERGFDNRFLVLHPI